MCGGGCKITPTCPAKWEEGSRDLWGNTKGDSVISLNDGEEKEIPQGGTRKVTVPSTKRTTQKIGNGGGKNQNPPKALGREAKVKKAVETEPGQEKVVRLKSRQEEG